MQQSQSHRYSTQHGLTRLTLNIIGFLYLLFAILQNASFAQANLLNQHLEANSSCHFEILNIEVAQATANQPEHVPQSGWERVQLPDDWEKRWAHYTGSAWYKIQWRYQCNQDHQAVALLIERINLAGAIYSNNELLWKDKSLVEPLSRSWNMPRYWVLPSSSVQNKQNEILVRVVGVSSQHSGLGKIRFGRAEDIVNQNDQLIFERRTLFLINIIISFVLGTIGFTIWLFRREEKAFGWFGLTSFFWVLFAYNIISTVPLPFTDTLFTARLNLVFLVGYVYCLCLFAWRFALQQYTYLERLLFASFMICIIALLFTPNAYLTKSLLITFLYAGLVFIFNCLLFQWIAFKKPKVDILLLAFIFLIYLVIIVHDLYIMLHHDDQELYWTPFTAPITSLAISFILAYRISQNVSRIEKFNQTLEETVETVTFDLEQSLEKKHQLQIDNMRLQERLNLSHELHDGLGGSIVRSMILLEHSEHIEKQQVLSMFKLLRNDLRQVIDSGTSLGEKVPENPIMWAAPLRHRFVQLFEEMEIESTWVFAENWLLKPPPLICLTLSRVAEEALTNIIKHSQASDVEVALVENERQQLILTIQDNGIGFEVDQVQSGLHVGLQSMQVRVKRIGGSFEIHSQQGFTLIRAILPLKDKND